jgi:flagellar motor switch protein FliN/FliY
VSDQVHVDAVAESMGLPPEAVIAQPEGGTGVEHAAGRIGVILGIDLPVIVRFGRTELPIRSLSKLGPGSVIELGRSPDDPVDVLVGDRVVARGEVVIVGGNYGVRILEVITNPFRERRSARASGVAPAQDAAAARPVEA